MRTKRCSSLNSSRERIDRFPGFDKDTFETLSDEDWKRFNDETCQACTVTGVSVVYAATEPYAAAWERADYSYPDWWRASPTPAQSHGRVGADRRRRISARGVHPDGRPVESRPHRSRAAAKTTGRREADPSPHFDGRAQPGDVLGVETGGERTYIGDTAEDENKRRQDAEAAVRQSKD